MKVLFLDIDGVVNNRTSNMKTHFPLDEYCAFLIGKIQLDTNCKVVLSSAWRHLPDGIEEIKKRVVDIYDTTGQCCSGIRGVEIYNWVQKHKPEKYAILDDDSDMLLWQKDHFFQTKSEVGITKEIADLVIKHLNN